MTMTIEEQFAAAVKRQNKNVFKEAGMAAAMLKMLHEGIAPVNHIIAPDIWDQPERWSPAQADVFKWIITLPDSPINYLEAQKKFEECESVSEIFNIYWHLCWMYGFNITCENDEEVEALFEAVDQCQDCYEGVALFAYQYVLMKEPMSPSACAMLAHSPYQMEFIMMLEEILAATADGFVPAGEMTLSLQDI
jgi:hypothetical protein